MKQREITKGFYSDELGQIITYKPKSRFLVFIIAIARIILTSIMLYGIYTETGIWSTAFAFVVALRIEVEEFMERN